ncbi:MAG: EAL domain-containing protein [Oricola sp.]
MAAEMISIDEIPDAVFVVDRDGTICTVNAVVSALFGYRPDELVGEKVEILVPGRYRNHEKTRERYQAKPFARPMGRLQQIYARRKDGSEFPVDISLRPVREDGTVICMLRDISEHVRLSNAIRDTAYQDMVTGTMNRRAFYEELTGLLSCPATAQPGTCVAFFDLDHFKDVNDSLGHNCGDQLLADFCNRLREIMDDDMRLFRIGGDEFAVIVPNCADHARAREFVDTAIRFVRRPYTIEGHRIGIGCSAGIVHAPTDGGTAEELISNADLALYEAKSVRGTSFVFTPRLRDAVEQRFSLLTELRNAGEDGQFELHYQPQVDIRSGAITGAEALLRWAHPTRGLLQPGQFIDVLSDSELSVTIGRWALFEACRQAAAWQTKADRPIRIAVNLFPWQVKTRKFFDDVREALHSAGLDATLLELELTENTIIESSEEFIAILSAVRDQGVNIALDDFGTGYASLNSLTRFPINTIKIDRSFVRDVGSGKGNWPVLRTMPKLARDLGLTTVAEGVETAEDAMMIQHFGYDFGQGYYWGKAAGSDEFSAMIEHGLPEKPAAGSGDFRPVRISSLEEIVKRRFPMFG